MSYVNCLIALWPALGKSREPPLSQPQSDRKLKVIYCVRGVSGPLLANIYLDALDRELEQRGLAFSR